MFGRTLPNKKGVKIKQWSITSHEIRGSEQHRKKSAREIHMIQTVKLLLKGQTTTALLKLKRKVKKIEMLSVNLKWCLYLHQQLPLDDKQQ